MMQLMQWEGFVKSRADCLVVENVGNNFLWMMARGGEQRMMKNEDGRKGWCVLLSK